MESGDIDDYEYTNVKHYLLWQIGALIFYLAVVAASQFVVLIDAVITSFILFVCFLALVLFQHNIRNRVSNWRQFFNWFVIDAVAVIVVLVIFSL